MLKNVCPVPVFTIMKPECPNSPETTVCKTKHSFKMTLELYLITIILRSLFNSVNSPKFLTQRTYFFWEGIPNRRSHDWNLKILHCIA